MLIAVRICWDGNVKSLDNVISMSLYSATEGKCKHGIVKEVKPCLFSCGDIKTFSSCNYHRELIVEVYDANKENNTP